MTRPTIRQVAEWAGVSPSTVSRVLNGYPFVTDGLRARVLEARDALEYHPDAAARTMRTGESRAVGFVVSDFSNPVFSAIAVGADAVLRANGYSLVIANSGGDPGREAEAMSMLRQRRVDGLIIAVADERAPGLADRLRRQPGVCLLDREVRRAAADAVRCDHARGMADAVEHLMALGHRRIALVAGSQSQRGSRERVRAFRASLDGLLDERLVRTGELSRETGYLAAQELLSLDDPPTALIAGNNQLFAGVLHAVRDRRLRVPAELSLVACDDTDLARLHDPPVDVIARDPLELGRAAAELVLARCADGSAPPRREVLPTRFEARASSAFARERVA